MAEPVALKYRAFISYSHADTSWAKWLHRVLEGFRIDGDLVGRETTTGTIPKALRPVFRDRDDFTAGHTLSEQTLAALDASHALIVICSPASAKSQYVNEETQLFKSRHPVEAELSPGLGVGGNAAWVVVSHAGDKPRPDPRQGVLLKAPPKDPKGVLALQSVDAILREPHAFRLRLLETSRSSGPDA